MSTAAALLSAAAAARVPNNQQPKLVPPAGVWRGAELGTQFKNSTDADAVGNFDARYPSTPLHVYRIFTPWDGLPVSPETRAWVKRGGILWYNMKAGNDMSWAAAVAGDYDATIESWAAQVQSLAPANVFTVLYHEPDHAVCFTKCEAGGVPGNTPANYRAMFNRVQGIFKAKGVTNAVWAMDYSTKIQNHTVADTAVGCTAESCSPAAAVVPLWPGDDRVDWLFFNAFEKGKVKPNKIKVKLTFNQIVGTIYDLLTAIPNDPATMKHCGSGSCNFGSHPWGLGAFASHDILTAQQRVQFFADATASFSTYPKIKAHLYYNSKDSQVLDGTDPTVDQAYRQYLAAKEFAVNDPAA